MITLATLNDEINENIAAYRTRRDAIRADLETFERCYKETCDGTPADTVNALAEAIGMDRAAIITASIVNAIPDYDLRVYDYIREWAAGVSGSYDAEAAQKLYLYTTIHPVHINQIATEMRKR